MNCIWALAKLGYRSISTALATADGNDLSNFPRDRAYPDHSGRHLIVALCFRMEEVTEDLNQMEVSSALWALGTLGGYAIGGAMGGAIGGAMERC